MTLLNGRAVYAVKRSVQWYGRPIDFWRKAKNKYGEETGSREIVTTLRCVYHSTSIMSNRSETDAARTNSGQGEYLLTLYNPDIKPDDICLFNRKEYRVMDVYSLDKADSIMEISIEEVR